MKKIKTVVNGCFDLFHEGHETILRYALNLCQYGTVLVLINSDESVAKLKGSNRPIDPIDKRITNIEECKRRWCLDHMEYPSLIIKIFDTEEELAKKIDEFKPDLIIKGNDYTDTTMVTGSDKWPVLIYPRIKDKSGEVISTTREIKKNET